MESAIQRLRNSGAQFSETYFHFVNIPPEFRPANYEAVKKLVDATRNSIASVTRAMDNAMGWANAAFGFTGVDAMQAFPNAQILANGGVGTAITAIMLARTKMLDVLQNARKRQFLHETNSQRVNDGLEPLADNTIGGLQETTNQIGIETWLIVGGVAIFLLPKLLERMKGYK
jgi:hypothetical protein